jgi:hypothetical protein
MRRNFGKFHAYMEVDTSQKYMVNYKTKQDQRKLKIYFLANSSFKLKYCVNGPFFAVASACGGVSKRQGVDRDREREK